MVTLKARKLKLEDVHSLMGYEPIYEGGFEAYLELEPLNTRETEDLAQIRQHFLRYLSLGKISEGQARIISVIPLLQIAGYYEPPIQLKLEEDIDRFYVEDQDTYITGRFDILAVNRSVEVDSTIPLWVLIVESKNMDASEYAGVAQMLAYAHASLERQKSVWGLVTNGSTYQFFYLQKGTAKIYQYMPLLSLRETQGAAAILQVLKAIRDWQP